MNSYSEDTVKQVMDLLHSLLEIQDTDGSAFSNVYTTYFLLECLAWLENPAYYDRIQSARSWCIRNRTKEVNPYRMLAYLEDETKLSINFFKQVDKLIKLHRLENGSFLFNRRFIAEGGSFSTLIALKLLVLIPNGNIYEPYTRSALRYCYNNIWSFGSVDQLGFLIWLYSHVKYPEFSNINAQVLSTILDRQKGGFWEDNILSTCYIAYDLMPHYKKDHRVQKSVNEAVNTLSDVEISLEKTGYFETIRYIMILVAYYGDVFRQALRSYTIPLK